jgi:hypothetical protein
MCRPNIGPLAGFHLLMVAAVFCAPVYAAQASEWKPFGLQGTVVRSIAAAQDLLCVGTQGQGVHCIELGVPQPRWRSLGPRDATILWLWIDPLNPDVRFAAADSASGGPTLYRSLDGGGSGESIENLPVPMGGVARVFMVDGVAGTGTVIAAGGSIWRTDDQGESWILLSPEGGLFSLEIAPTDPDTIWVGGETAIFMGFTRVSRDGGVNWATVWDSREIGDNQTSSISAHPDRDGLVLTGHEGFILRTEDHGGGFDQVLTAPARFFIDWDGDHPFRVYGAGSPNDQQGHAFVSRDLGISWSDVTDPTLSGRMIFQLAADDRRLGVAYVATDDGIYRFYGGGPSGLPRHHRRAWGRPALARRVSSALRPGSSSLESRSGDTGFVTRLPEPHPRRCHRFPPGERPAFGESHRPGRGRMPHRRRPVAGHDRPA